jgi:hypothetical protein
VSCHTVQHGIGLLRERGLVASQGNLVTQPAPPGS